MVIIMEYYFLVRRQDFITDGIMVLMWSLKPELLEKYLEDDYEILTEEQLLEGLMEVD